MKHQAGGNRWPSGNILDLQMYVMPPKIFEKVRKKLWEQDVWLASPIILLGALALPVPPVPVWCHTMKSPFREVGICRNNYPIRLLILIETLLHSGKSIFAPRRISFHNKITAGGLISSRNSLRGDFQIGDIISWHLLNLAPCLAAIWTNGTIFAWTMGYIFANFA